MYVVILFAVAKPVSVMLIGFLASKEEELVLLLF